MKVCFDTNVVLDIFARPDKFCDPVFAYDVANLRGHETVMPVSSTTDISYILSRAGLDRDEVIHALENIMELFDLYSVNSADCAQALESQMEDFKDAFLAASAQRCDVDLIISRNEKDFEHSPVPVMSPDEFMEQFCPSDYHYDQVAL